MRLDKFLKVSRVIRRRTVANDICSAGRVSINGRPAKPGTAVKPGDLLEIAFGNGKTRVRIKEIRESVRKEQAADLYELLEDSPDNQE